MFEQRSPSVLGLIRTFEGDHEILSDQLTQLVSAADLVASHLSRVAAVLMSLRGAYQLLENAPSADEVAAARQSMKDSVQPNCEIVFDEQAFLADGPERETLTIAEIVGDPPEEIIAEEVEKIGGGSRRNA